VKLAKDLDELLNELDEDDHKRSVSPNYLAVNK
jgi:hypothetical protein